MITGNFKSLIELMRTFSDEQKYIDYLESVIWNANIKLQYGCIRHPQKVFRLRNFNENSGGDTKNITMHQNSLMYAPKRQSYKNG